MYSKIKFFVYRQERELCFNDIDLSKEKCRRLRSRLWEAIQNNSGPRNKFIKRSLENVSTKLYGEFETEQYALRRSRSLAISRGPIFDDLFVSSGGRRRRQQLIPRAKLIDKNDPKERYATRDCDVYRTNVNRKCSNVSSNYALPRTLSQNNLDCQNSKDSCADFGLSLPNYYPDSEISLTDLSSDKYSFKEERKRSVENLCEEGSPAEIIYRDNISFGKSFDEKYTKPRTLREYTPFGRDFYESKARSLPNYDIRFGEKEEETTTEAKIYEELDEIFKEETVKNDSDFSQSDLNFDEINLNNDNITKTFESPDSYLESNPIYDEITFSESPSEEKTILKTRVRVEPENSKDEYKTIVAVEEDTKDKQRGHNYLRDFVDSQRVSKKPLQNFLSKKISRALGESKKNNRYHSLPDLSVGKNLRHCEKIDKKLRKCENSNRFIVNIGRHLDVTAETNIPVDFEVKISKIPKAGRVKSTKEETFVDAVKNLNTTLGGLTQPKTETETRAIRSICPKYKKRKDGSVSVAVENKNEKSKLPRINEANEMEADANKEYQEKLGTVRNYWEKMNDNENSNASPKCKIVDVQTKVEEVIKKFEGREEKNAEQQESMVKVTKKMFELKEKSGKTSPIKEKMDIFEQRNRYESLNPNAVEIISEKEESFVKSLGSAFETDFDHVRYRVMKSDLFQKNIFANCQKESQFDGLMQYLQHYSFQELLIDNNIVIIEPIRTKVDHQIVANEKTTKNVTKLIHRADHDPKESNLRRHFFYHPIRVNKEMNEEELPNPDTVKLVRQLFESGLKKAQSSQDLGKTSKTTKKTVQYQTVESNKDKSSLTTFETEHGRNRNFVYEQHISEDILQKIRERGTCVTYYGGKVLREKNERPNPMTETIMEEIKENYSHSRHNNRDSYNGIKFKLLKSNSCSSRIELVGTENLKGEKLDYSNSNFVEEKNRQNLRKNSSIEEEGERNDVKQLTRWGNGSEEKTYNNIAINKSTKKLNYDYRNYERVETISKRTNDMEFETYEIADK
ncbi:hypothetical protein FQA39_LY13556 [Lamprigera yunnana]|nr:hypothetical protein FQA39_LY13556 [Lamprigera yunnana]